MGRGARVHKTASRISGSARFHDVLSVLQIPVVPFQANAYLAWDRAPGEAILVDAAAEGDRLLSELEARQLSLAAILQTHAHGDHIAAFDDVEAATGAPVYLHPDAEPMLRSPEINLSLFAGIPVRAAVPYRSVREGEELTLLDRAVRV